MPKRTPIKKSLHSNSCTSITTGWKSSTKGGNQKVSTLGERLSSHTINLDTALKSRNWNHRKFLQFDNLDSTQFSNSFFFSKLWPWALSSGSQSLVFYLFCIVLSENVTSHLLSGSLSHRNLIFFQLYLLHFPFSIYIISSLLEEDGSFLKIMKFVFHIGLGVLIDEMWQKLY